MSRPLGLPELSLEQINKIVELTQKGLLRPAIAREVGCSKQSVWKYQKNFNLL